MPLKLVLDTNLIVSVHLNPDGLERLVLNLALTSQVEFFVDWPLSPLGQVVP